MESAEILEGLKPANLVNITNREQPCGRNLYQLWLKWGDNLLAPSGLKVRVLRLSTDSLLLFVYHEKTLTSLVAERRVATMLKKAGYPCPENLEVTLEELEKRIGEGSFPHEVGIFLGYPLKDVAAFMGWAAIPFTCQGPWKIYGDPRLSLQLAERHRDCRRRMAWQMASCDNPLRFLRRCA
jgi:hypothetical protein